MIAQADVKIQDQMRSTGPFPLDHIRTDNRNIGHRHKNVDPSRLHAHELGSGKDQR